MSKLQAKPDGSIQKTWCWCDKGLMEREKCLWIITQRSAVSLNAGPREKERLEGGSNFHGRLPEDETGCHGAMITDCLHTRNRKNTVEK